MAALLNVLALRYALLRSLGEGDGATEAELAEFQKAVEPAALDLLVSELRLGAKADALGVTDIQGTADRLLRREPDSDLTGKMDTKALVRLGLMRILLWRGDLTDAMDSPQPYESAAPQIAALVEELLIEYPSTVPIDKPLFQKATPDYLNLVFGLVFSVRRTGSRPMTGKSSACLLHRMRVEPFLPSTVATW